MSLTFDEYQARTGDTAIYPGQGQGLGLIYVALKGAGEAGEFAEHVGKAIRDERFSEDLYEEPAGGYLGEVQLTPERRELLKKEVGDQLWYLARKAEELGCKLSDIAFANLAKLADRKERGVLGGSGDNR